MTSHLIGHTTIIPKFMKRSKPSYLSTMFRKSRQHVVYSCSCVENGRIRRALFQRVQIPVGLPISIFGSLCDSLYDV